MNTGEIFTEMASRQLCVSMREFSEVWLSRSHNFTSTHWDKPLPAATLIHLRAVLLAEGHPDLAAKLLLVLLGEHTAPTTPAVQQPTLAAFFGGHAG